MMSRAESPGDEAFVSSAVAYVCADSEEQRAKLSSAQTTTTLVAERNDLRRYFRRYSTIINCCHVPSSASTCAVSVR
jgi:hypothetical protein